MSDTQIFHDGSVVLHAGDCFNVIRSMPNNIVDSIVTDPPYNLSFMGKKWDTGETAFSVLFWAEVLRVLKPGGHVVAFSGTRTYHRLAVAIEDAGFEIRDQLAWVYGTGFPKSHNVSKGIDKAAGVERTKIRIPASAVGNQKARQDTRPYIELAKERGYHEIDSDKPETDAAKQWAGWGTALKPSWEPIVLARKPLIGTVVENVLAHGTGGLNVDECRVEADDKPVTWATPRGGIWTTDAEVSAELLTSAKGRFPANLIHDGSPEVLAGFPQTSARGNKGRSASPQRISAAGHEYGLKGNLCGEEFNYDEGGSAARFFASFPQEIGGRRFFYSSKANARDRAGSKHPTVKPVSLMRWLCRLVTPPGGTVLDPFAGSGTTGQAALEEGFRAVLCEREAEYQADIARRMMLCLSGPDERARANIKARYGNLPAGPMFDTLVADAE